jgi:hypothetical protein
VFSVALFRAVKRAGQLADSPSSDWEIELGAHSMYILYKHMFEPFFK